MSLEQRRKIAALGGKKQSKATNPGNFARNIKRAVIEGRKGGLASALTRRKTHVKNSNQKTA